ncbi:MAG TPA: hypothetical protein VEV16_01575 [Daejeonella sp.]|nr:hypothetical protein [Daejeonella sp.]
MKTRVGLLERGENLIQNSHPVFTGDLAAIYGVNCLVQQGVIAVKNQERNETIINSQTR